MRKTSVRFSGRALGAMLIGSVLVLAACGSSGGSSSGYTVSVGPMLSLYVIL